MAITMTGNFRRYQPAILAWSTLALFVLLVEALVRLDVLSIYVVPLPSTIFAAIPRVVAEEDILRRLLLSGGEALAAAALLVIVGTSVGIALYRSRLLRTATETWIAAFAAAPLVLAYPLFLVIFGRSALTIIMLGFLAGVAPMILKTLEGLTLVRPTLLNVGRSFNLSPWNLFWKVHFPAAVPTIFTGIRLSLIFALINVFGLEFLINFGGLGQLVNELSERYDLPGTYVAIGCVIAVSIFFFLAIEKLERWLRPGG